MTERPDVSIVEQLFECLHEACRDSAQVVWIAPYTKKPIVESLIEAIPNAASLTLITRWAPEDVARGVSDTSVYDVISSRNNSDIFLHPTLHAKVFLCNDIVFIGSANLTAAGVGIGQHPNAELSVRLQPIPAAVHVYIKRLIYESTIATAKLKVAIEEQASRYSYTFPDDEDVSTVVANELTQEWSPRWLFPQLRAPDRLYSAYSGADDLPSDVQEDAWRDLAIIAPPTDLELESFYSWVGSRLLQIDVVARFDEFVATPRRFGEMSDWFRQNYGHLVSSHTEGQLVAQQMIRWLTFFLPQRYTLDTPNYSEVFSRNV